MQQITSERPQEDTDADQLRQGEANAHASALKAVLANKFINKYS